MSARRGWRRWIVVNKTKSERHHWWPKCVSTHWESEQGGVTRITPNGNEVTSKPENFGVIGNGHIIKLGQPGEQTSWDQNFESFFSKADGNFPKLIDLLKQLPSVPKFGNARTQRFTSHEVSDDVFRGAIESVTSLSVRSPMTRETCVSLAEKFRGPLPPHQRNAIIALNMRDIHQRAIQNFGMRGKLAVLFSPAREFIFGDGFYHNIGTPGNVTMTPRILAPLTPRIAVLYAIPRQHRLDQRFFTLVIDAKEAEELNNTVQIYSRNEIFYSNEKPELIDEYRQGKHLQYRFMRNPVEAYVDSMPGVTPRDTSYDFLDELKAHRET